MQVILLQKIRNLGGIGDEVNVKNGYARNFLIPLKKAVRATKENIKAFEERRAELEAKEKALLAEAEKRSSAIEKLTLKLLARASEEGKLYGSIGTREIANFITEKGVEVHRSEIILPEGALRQVGEYDISVQLHSDVVVEVKLVIEAEAMTE